MTQITPAGRRGELTDEGSGGNHDDYPQVSASAEGTDGKAGHSRIRSKAANETYRFVGSRLGVPLGCPTALPIATIWWSLSDSDLAAVSASLGH